MHGSASRKRSRVSLRLTGPRQDRVAVPKGFEGGERYVKRRRGGKRVVWMRSAEAGGQTGRTRVSAKERLHPHTGPEPKSGMRKAPKSLKHPSQALQHLNQLEETVAAAMATQVYERAQRRIQHSRSGLLSVDDVYYYLGLNPQLHIQTKQSRTTFSERLLYEQRKLNTVKEDLDLALRFRGGSAVENVRSSDAKASFTLHLFQQGFSINSPEENFRPYDSTANTFLEYIDNGLIPPMIDTIATAPGNPKFVYHDGCLVIDLVDYRGQPKDMGAGSPKPQCSKVLLQPAADSLYTDIDTIVTESGQKMDAIAMEQQILHTTSKPLCLEPSAAIFQLSLLANANKCRANVRLLEARRLYQTCSDAATLSAILAEAQQKPSAISTHDSSSSLGHVFRCMVTRESKEREQRAAMAHNALLNDALFRGTVFNPSPAAMNQTHLSSVIFAKKAMQTPIATNDPRLTIMSGVRPKAPSARRPPVDPKAGQPVESLRFYAQPLAQMHDLFVFPKGYRGSQSTASSKETKPTSTHEGIIKTSSDGVRGYDIVRFKVGNGRSKATFIKQFEQQSTREGCVKINHNPPPTNPDFANYLSLYPAETERQRKQLEQKMAKQRAFVSNPPARAPPTESLTSQSSQPMMDTMSMSSMQSKSPTSSQGSNAPPSLAVESSPALSGQTISLNQRFLLQNRISQNSIRRQSRG